MSTSSLSSRINVQQMNQQKWRGLLRWTPFIFCFKLLLKWKGKNINGKIFAKIPCVTLMCYSCIFSWQSFFFTSLQLVKQAIFFGHGSLWIYKRVILNFCWFCFKPDFIISFDYSVKVVHGKWLLCQENIYLIKAMFVLKVWHNFWFIKVYNFIQNYN